MLLLVFGRFLACQKIPEAFLESNYFTSRAQLVELLKEKPQGFEANLRQPQVDQDMRVAIVADYRVLANKVRQQFLSSYPFEVVAITIVDFGHPQFHLMRRNLQEIRQHALTVPGSRQKFGDLAALLDTYSKTPEIKVLNYDRHFTPGSVRVKMTSEAAFINALLINGSRITSKCVATLNARGLVRKIH